MVPSLSHLSVFLWNPASCRMLVYKCWREDRAISLEIELLNLLQLAISISNHIRKGLLKGNLYVLRTLQKALLFSQGIVPACNRLMFPGETHEQIDILICRFIGSILRILDQIFIFEFEFCHSLHSVMRIKGTDERRNPLLAPIPVVSPKV